MRAVTALPLVGRDAERSALATALRQVRRGGFRCVLVDGEPGIGKTRLAAELLARASGVLPLRAQGHLAGVAVAFGLWAEALDGHLRSWTDAEVMAACGGHVADLSGVLRAAARVHGAWRTDVPLGLVREGIVVIVDNLSRQHPLLVLLDDVHLADASSWDTLGYLARGLVDRPVLVVLCARLPELVERTAAEHVLFGLEQEGLLNRIDLRPLSEPDLRELAERALGRPTAPPGLAAWLFQRSRGNPLFACSLLEAVLDAGGDPEAPGTAEIPAALAARVDARVASLDDASSDALHLLAVIGRPANVDELAAEPDALDRLVRARLVVARSDDGRYEISHPLVQDCVYAALAPSCRRALHRQVATVLTGTNRRAEAARHYARSAVPGDAEALAALVDVLREAWARQVFAEAFVTLGALTQVLDPGDPRWADVLDAVPLRQEWLASYNRIALDVGTGMAAFRLIEEALTGTDDLVRLATVNLYMAGLLGWCLAELAQAGARAQQAEQLYRRSGADHLARLARLERVWLRALERRYVDLQNEAGALLAEAESVGDEEVALGALAAYGAAAHFRGDTDTAVPALSDLARRADVSGSTARSVFARTILAHHLAETGDLAAARALIAEVHSGTSPERDHIAEEAPLVIALHAGDLAAVVDQGPAVAAGSGPTQQAFVLIWVAVAAAETGDVAAARRHLAVAQRVLGRRPFWVVGDYLARAAGLVAWVAGDLDSAVTKLDLAAGEFASTGALPLACASFVDLAEVAADARRPEVASGAASAATDLAERLGQPHFTELAALARAASALASGHEVNADAEAAARALLERGYLLIGARGLDLVGRHLLHRDRRAALERLREAAALFDRCGDTWRRERVFGTLRQLGNPGQRAIASAGGPDSLTDREREVVVLAIRGMSAREIGEQLHIGERTVESHLARAFVRFGVHSRQELRHALEHVTDG